MALSETWGMDQWLKATLLAAAPVTALVSTRVHSDEAPERGTLPCVVFNLETTEDYNGIAGHRGIVHAVYTVKGIVSGSSYTAAAAIAAAIDDALHRQSGAVGGVTIQFCERDGEVRLAEDYPIEDRHYRHMGATYHVWAYVT